MGLLGEIFSSGDRMKRKLRGLLDDPMGTIALGSQRMSEDVQQMGLLADESGYLPGTNSVLLTPQQKERARKALADKGAEMAMAAATVWHGSPHKFDKFDSSKIGTGEGAQAYGHGLYLAESPAVAKSYQEALAPGVQRTVDGMPYDMANPFHVASSYASMYGKRGRSPQQIAEMLVADGKPEAAKVLLSGKVGKMADAPAGSLYKVDLPDNAIARMLDWDKPLSQQPKNVQRALAKIPERKIWQEEYEKALPRQEAARAAKDYGSVDFDAADYWLSQINRHYGENATGGQVIGRLKGSVSPVEAAKNLKKLGIPGVRYLDQGSRVAGEGSSNFVVFPGQEDILKILERNGVPIK